MKRIYFCFILVMCVCSETFAQCNVVLQEKIRQFDQYCKSNQMDVNQWSALEFSFQNLDVTCKDEFGNQAALYVARIRDIKTEIQLKKQEQALRAKIAAQKKAEAERQELERLKKEQENRIAQNLVFMEGYGRLKEGQDYNIVSLIKGELTKSYNYKYTTNPNKAVWAVYIAVDARNVHPVTNFGDNFYKAYAVPMIVVKNLITDEILYEGSGLEFSEDYRGEDAKEAQGASGELAVIRSAFRKTIKPLCLTISNYIPHD